MLQMFAVFSFFGAGIFFACLPFRPELRHLLAHNLVNKPELCTWAGISFFGVAALFAIGFYASTRGRYLTLRLGANLTRIDAKILHRTIGNHLQKQFATAIQLNNVGIIRDKHLELQVQMAPMEETAKDQLLADVEVHLAKLLSERFGYHAPFTMQILD
jgi:hypothetical protein